MVAPELMSPVVGLLEKLMLTFYFWRPRASLFHYNERGLDFWELVHGPPVAARVFCAVS